MAPTPVVTFSPAHSIGLPNVAEIPTEAIADAHWQGFDLDQVFTLTRHQLLVALWFEATPYGHYYEQWDDWAVNTAFPFLAGWRTGIDAWQVPLPPRGL